MSAHFKNWLSENCYGTYNDIEITPESEVVVYKYVISLGVVTFTRKTQIYFKEVEQDEILNAKILCIMCNLLLGWWGFPFGPIMTIKETYCDITDYYATTWGAIVDQR